MSVFAKHGAAWRLWSIGTGWVVVLLLLVAPPTGLFVLWKVLIPIAPLLLFLAPGVWRQVCPLGSVAVLPRNLGWRHPRQAVAPEKAQERFLLAGAIGLLLIPPLRPLLLDRSGPLTAAALLAYGALALYLGFRYAGRGVFCNALCPVHFVELMYGQASKPLRLPLPCRTCDRCSPACIDVQGAAAWTEARRAPLYRSVALGFPGFVYGWFQIPKAPPVTLPSVLEVYAPTLGGFLVSYLLLFLAATLLPKRRVELFASLGALGIYYWYQVPNIACNWFGSGCSPIP